MKQKLLASILIVAMLFSLVPTAAFAADTHKHCVCGGDVITGNHTTHSAITFTPWNETDAMPTASGNYVLMNDVTLSSAWYPVDGTVLCLNGNDIKVDGNTDSRVIYIESHKSLVLCDCSEQPGKITGGHDNDWGGGIHIDINATLTMYNGQITGNSAGAGAGVYNSGIFNMYGGKIYGNTADSYGGGVCHDGNTAYRAMTISGNAAITDNSLNDGTDSNLHVGTRSGEIGKVTISDDFSGNVGISMYEYGVFSVGGKNCSQYFTADNTDYAIAVDGENLKLIAHTHAYNELKWNETEHWYECSCGVEESGNRVGHSGGTATCTAKAACSTCNVEYGNELEHDFANGNWVTTDAAHHWKVCKDCTTEDTGNKMPHEYDNDCDTDCNVCGHTRSITHNYEWVIDKAATQSETGLKHEECTICHDKRSENTAIDKLPTPPTPPTGGSGGFTGDYNYPVIISPNDNGSAILSDSNAVEGESVTITTKPNKGYGAADVIVTDEDGNVISVTDLGNGQYAFTMPDCEVSIEVVYKPAITMVIDSVYINVFGKIIKNDVAPIIVGDRTMLPIRVVAEALGAEVDWDAELQKVTITKGDTVIELFIGETTAYVNGKAVQLDVAPFIDNNRTYLPVRFVSEYLGAVVHWDGDTRTVTILENE